MRPATLPAAPPSTRRRSIASLVLALSLLLAACSGAAETTSSDAATDTATAASTEAAEVTEEPTADGLAGEEDPVDPEGADPALGDPGQVVCEGALAIVQLIGDASNPQNDDDQIRDAVELMGQTIGDLEAAGADPAIIEAAEAIHEQFAVVVNDPTVEPEYAAIEAAGAVLGGQLDSCGYTTDDIAGATADAEPGGYDAPFCAAVGDFVAAGEAFGSAEVGSAEEQAAVGDMETAAFAFADAYGDTDQDATAAMFALYESAQQFVETGETGDVSAAGELVDSLAQQCAEAGL